MTGYIFNFKEHGAFSPDGKVADAMPQAEIDAHNRKLAQTEIEAMKATGRAVLYLGHAPGAFQRIDGYGCRKLAFGRYADVTVSTWEGSFKIQGHARLGQHNIGRTRFDVWFNFDGSRWHGVNIGDNQIVRCRRTKGVR